MMTYWFYLIGVGAACQAIRDYEKKTGDGPMSWFVLFVIASSWPYHLIYFAVTRALEFKS